MKFLKKNKSVFIYLLGIIICGYYTAPTYSENQKMTDQLLDLTEELNTKEAERDSLKLLKTEMKDAFEDVKKQIPIGAEQENVIRDLNRLVAASGLSFTSLSFAVGHNAQINVDHLSINFSVEGSVKQIRELLQRIEQNQRFMGLDNLNISGLEDQNNKKTTLSLNIYALFQD